MGNTDNNIEQGSNICLLDGPIGRLRFFLIAMIFFAYSAFVELIILTYSSQGINVNIYLYYTLSAIFGFLIPFYFAAVNAIKRLYDIVGEQKKAILYYILYLIISLCFVALSKFVSEKFSIIGIILSLAMTCTLLFLKGKFITPKTKDQKEEE